MTMPSDGGEQDPARQPAAPLPMGSPAGERFPRGTFPPGPVPTWPIPYPPPPGRGALTFARVVLGIQAALWGMLGIQGFLGTLVVAGQRPTARETIILLVDIAVVAGVVTMAFRLAPSRRGVWWLALATQAALVVLYGSVFTWMAVAPSPEGMASFAALIMGPVVTAIPVIGLVALLLPSARAVAFRRP
jgi:hypothetical protein